MPKCNICRCKTEQSCFDCLENGKRWYCCNECQISKPYKLHTAIHKDLESVLVEADKRSKSEALGGEEEVNLNPPKKQVQDGDYNSSSEEKDWRKELGEMSTQGGSPGTSESESEEEEDFYDDVDSEDEILGTWEELTAQAKSGPVVGTVSDFYTSSQATKSKRDLLTRTISLMKPKKWFELWNHDPKAVAVFLFECVIVTFGVCLHTENKNKVRLSQSTHWKQSISEPRRRLSLDLKVENVELKLDFASPSLESFLPFDSFQFKVKAAWKMIEYSRKDYDLSYVTNNSIFSEFLKYSALDYIKIQPQKPRVSRIATELVNYWPSEQFDQARGLDQAIGKTLRFISGGLYRVGDFVLDTQVFTIEDNKWRTDSRPIKSKRFKLDSALFSLKE